MESWTDGWACLLTHWRTVLCFAFRISLCFAVVLYRHACRRRNPHTPSSSQDLLFFQIPGHHGCGGTKVTSWSATAGSCSCSCPILCTPPFLTLPNRTPTVLCHCFSRLHIHIIASHLPSQLSSQHHHLHKTHNLLPRNAN